MRPPSVAWPVRRLREGALAPSEEDALAAEEPLEIRLDGRPLVVTMRTPGHDEELALGFLVDEGILRPNAEATVATLRNPLDPAHDNIVNVAAPPDALLRHPASRSFHASSACGVCGQASLEDMARTFAPVTSALALRHEEVLALPARMRAEQSVFDRTGGLHAAALVDRDLRVACLREDVGRHNAVDKVVGWAQRARRLPLGEHALVVSGRAGYEVVQKAVAAGIPIVAAVGAPSSLAARLAEQAGVTLIGFLREKGFNVYA
ncbi:MAG TPA: formate dehydrogenase accessory sulfurtransferase FdhD, partial [Candidatus Thermoplasmatota archaeon]|nr:formate dehydrogenase accessory sulfurtransferase FdhD [Candidatus Thermoplasmatota archaeon]